MNVNENKERGSTMDAQEIMEALDTRERVYQREAVQAAMEQRDEVVPRLVEVLERILQDPETFLEEENESFLPVYALYLLGYHRAREAHPLLIKVLSLPGDMPFDILGDGVHEGAPVALWKTSGGDPSGIMQLAKDRQANEYCRAAAIHALTYGVVDGSLTREEVVAFLQGLISEDNASGETASPDAPMVYNYAAKHLSLLWPGESMELIRKAMDDGLIEPFFIGLANVEQDLHEGKEARLADFVQRGQQDLERTPHEALHYWACFQSAGTRGGRGSTSHPGGPSAREKRAETRNKRKRQRRKARAARKKNRQRKKR